MKYLEIEGERWSHLRLLALGERAYVAGLAEPQSDTPAMRLGRLVHEFVLLGESQSVVWEGERRGKAWTTFAADNADREIVTISEYERALTIAQAVQRHPGAAELLARCSHREAVTTGVVHGVKAKGRTDGFGDSVLLDLKTTAGPIEHGPIARQVLDRLYHAQLCYYAAMLPPGKALHLIVVSTRVPHEVATYRLSADVIAHGEEVVRDLCEARLQLDPRNPRWQHPETQELTFPSWAYGSSGDDIADLGLV